MSTRGASLQITGFAEIKAALRQMNKNLALQTMRKVLRKSANEIKKAIINLAPKKTGALAKAVRVRAGKRKKDHASYLTSIGSAYFKGDTFYGAFLDLGHYHGSRKLQNRKYVEPLDFVGKGYRQVKDRLARELPAMIWDEIARSMSKTKKPKKAA